MQDIEAVRFHKPGHLDVIQLDTLPITQPSETQVLICPDHAGVNYIDIYFRSGLYPAKLPMTLGQECGGTVVAVGAQVTDVDVGDKVVAIAFGSFAERVLAERRLLAKIPDGHDVRSATAVFLQGLTAVTLTHEAYRIQKGDWVVVHAASGGTGTQLVKIAKHLGAHVVGTASTERKADMAREHGADRVVVYKEDEMDAFVDTVLSLTDGKGAQVVYDGVGRTTLDADFRAVARLGTIVSFGQSSGAIEPLPLQRLSEKNIRIMRPSLFNYLTTQADMDNQRVS
ncbi:NADPH:quinone reductase [Malassezia vespertilionis]|uniref:Probable quinone oxidoreductase n=1 Tax=Malassezia vespertilionis TaxID=2020962 RepID=A0A2N1JEW6_9BASI|nr:NADPH:quinone reductase [Malassezia vespertilionis]PKI85080.1 hypothetical protein MVES_001138 [Malassezia vespertilionis]WFD05873.1 NADPH:quinone reductase [Malassezia vespertilionis]